MYVRSCINRILPPSGHQLHQSAKRLGVGVYLLTGAPRLPENRAPIKGELDDLGESAFR